MIFVREYRSGITGGAFHVWGGPRWENFLEDAACTPLAQDEKIGVLLVNWGSSLPIPHMNRVPLHCEVVVLNPPQVVKNVASKVKMVQLLKDYNIPVPETILPPLVLKRDKHHGGHNVLSPELYAQKYIPFDREFRVHAVIVGNKFEFIVREKFPLPDNPDWQRNNRLGSSFKYPDPALVLEEWSAIRKLAFDTLSALSLDFGALDIGMTDGQFLVLECNSGPRLRVPSTLDFYRNCFRKCMKHLLKGTVLMTDEYTEEYQYPVSEP
jgi:hypothetical protein